MDEDAGSDTQDHILIWYGGVNYLVGDFICDTETVHRKFHVNETAGSAPLSYLLVSPTNFNTFVYSRFFNFNDLRSFNNEPRVSLYATPLTRDYGTYRNLREVIKLTFSGAGVFQHNPPRITNVSCS